MRSVNKVIFVLFAILTAALPGYGQVTFVSGGDFGTVNVGTPSVLTLMFQFSKDLNLGWAPAVVTQGQLGGDFNMTGGTCAPGSWRQGNMCSVQVTFTPAYPGLRMGAVIFVDQTNTVISSFYIWGTGSGSLPPGAATTTTSNAPIPPNALVVDAKENVYLAGFYGLYTMDNTTLAYVMKATTAAAIDGAGNIYVSDPLSNCVWKTTPLLTWPDYSQTRRTTQCMTTPPGVQIGRPLAVDKVGRVYVENLQVGEIVRFDASGALDHVAACGYEACDNWYSGALALDASGNLYVSTPYGGGCYQFGFEYACYSVVWKVIPLYADNPNAWTRVWVGFGKVDSLAVDAAGTLWITNGVDLYKAAQGSSPARIDAAAAGLSSWSPQWVTIDQAGNAWVADTVNSKVYELGNAGSFATLAPVNGQCGAANNQTMSAPPSQPGDLCTAGTTSVIVGSGPWTWTCAGTQGGITASCGANAPATPVNGQCGPANGTTRSTPPATGLCLAGNPLPVLGSGPWTWGCNGLNGGTSAGCTASVAQGSGACGTANGLSFASAPQSGLCAAGTASPATLSGSGPWSWTCTGANGTANCSAAAAAAACTAGTVSSTNAPNAGIVALGVDSSGNLYSAWRHQSIGSAIDRLHGGVWQSSYYWTTLYGMAVGRNGTIAYTTPGNVYIAPPGSTDFVGYYNLGAISIGTAAVDPAGNVYAPIGSAQGVHTIVKIPPGGGTTYVGGGTVCAAATDALGDGCPATSAVISTQTGYMASDGYGNIYFADDSNRIVRRVDRNTGIVTRVAGRIGYGGVCGDGDLATKACTGNIVGLAVDDAGDIYLSQYQQTAIRRVDGATGIITSLAIPGLSMPGALAADSQGKLYVADQQVARITGVTNLSGTSSTNCQAPTPVAGACGSANGQTLASAPTLASDLCSAGVAYPATGSGPWTWSCGGLNNGATASCSAQAATRQPQTISFPNPGPVTYGDSLYLSATASSGLDVTYSVTSGPALFSDGYLTIIGMGLVTVKASQAGDSNWLPATPVSVSFTAGPASLLAVAANVTIYQGSALPSPLTTANYYWFVNGDTAAVVHGSPTFSTTATSSSPPGNYPIVISQGTLSATNYTFQFQNGVLSVLARPTISLSLTPGAPSKQADGYHATLTITDNGSAAASNVLLTAATLGSATGSPLPQTVGTLAAGGSKTLTVVFPLSAGSSGAATVARYGGTYSGGTFTGSFRLTLP